MNEPTPPIDCKSCPATYQYASPFEAKEDVDEDRRLHAVTAGWLFVRDEGWLCPQCRAAFFPKRP